MFDPSGKPRLFGIAPGIDFPKELVAGLRARLADQPPHAMAQATVIVNTRRMARRLRDIFDAGPASFLPRILTLTDLEALEPAITLPAAISPLRRRLDLVQLVSRLLETDQTIAPRASLYALSDSLASLIDEMQGEGVAAETIANLDVSDQSGHWERAKRFLDIAQDYLAHMSDAPDAEARQRQLVLRSAQRWETDPIRTPVIVAGSTGSRGTTSLLMDAVARLPQGALVLPGFDFEGPLHMWDMLAGTPPREDHPQYRFYALMQSLNVNRSDIRPWAGAVPPSPD